MNSAYAMPLLGVTALAFSLAVGCGSSSSSSGSPSGSAGAPACFDYTGFAGMTPVTSFKTDVLPILRTSCGLSSSCHGDQVAHPPTQPFLGPPNTDGAVTADQVTAILGNIVGVRSLDEHDMEIVAAGDPQHSFLLFKLDGVTCSALSCPAKATCGLLMPQGNTEPMDAAKRDTIRRWVAQGAKND